MEENCDYFKVEDLARDAEEACEAMPFVPAAPLMQKMIQAVIRVGEDITETLFAFWP